ncbi:MAG: choline BCCT transporter BetT [Pseudolabrys sp.]|nr:choline BCCT transporter BetT [Pseudolabrys sp.]
MGKYLGTDINPPVFLISALLISLFVIFGAVFPDSAASLFNTIQTDIVDAFGWFYLAAVAVFLVFVIALALSSFGHIKLGPDHSEPQYSNLTWFSMLFSAGMGIGLMFFGVAEPIMHFTAPPVGTGGTVEAAREAMKITFFHWGLHAWAIYAVVGLSLAYFSFRHNLPLTMRSALYPLIGERIYGPLGHAVDIFAVIGTMFGIATSLGLGVLQINSGLTFLFGAPESIMLQLALITGITLLATVSVVLGLDVGIRRISELNLLLAVVLVLFVLLTGPTLFLFKAIVQNTGAYLSDVVNRSFNLYAYDPKGWIGGWTIFYWAWWIAWSPFVGMFIARISRGRTIREFVTGVLVVPVAFTFIWMTVFGNTAISLDMGALQGGISKAVGASVPTALFTLLQALPMTQIMSLVATLLVITFFVTSSDSGSLVIDTITSGGATNPPVWQRIFWALAEGVVASILLVAGGLKALQTASIAAALPFAFVLLFVCYGLLKALRMESQRKLTRDILPDVPARGTAVTWQQRLANIVSYPNRAKAEAFLRNVAGPALDAVAKEIDKTGATAGIAREEHRVTLEVLAGETAAPFHYGIRLRRYDIPSFAFPEFRPGEASEAESYYRAEVHLHEGGQGYDVLAYSQEQLIADVLSHFRKHMHMLHVVA